MEGCGSGSDQIYVSGFRHSAVGFGSGRRFDQAEKSPTETFDWRTANGRFWLEADIPGADRDVCFRGLSGHPERTAECLLMTRSGHRRIAHLADYTLRDVIDGLLMLVDRLTSDAVLDAAFDWLCQRRRDYPDHSDVWDFRRHWLREKARVRDDLRSRRFRFRLLDRVNRSSHRCRSIAATGCVYSWSK